MNQASYQQKLHSSLNSLLLSKTRLQSAQHKNQIKTILQQPLAFPSSTTQNNSQVIQQLLAYSIHSKRINQLLQWLQQNTQFLTIYSKQLQQIIKKYLETGNQVSKLDGQAGKNIRMLLAKKIIQDNNGLLNSLIQLSKSDQNICAKLLKIINQYLKQPISSTNNNKLGGCDITNLIILCLNILKIKQNINNTILKNCINLLQYFVCNNQQLQIHIIPSIINQILQLYKLQRAQKQSIQFINNFMKINISKQAMHHNVIQEYIENIINYLKQKVVNKQVIKSQKQCNLQYQYSVQICDFLMICYHFVKNKNGNIIEMEKQKYKNNKKQDKQSIENSNSNNNSSMGNKLEQQIIQLCKNMLLIVNSNCVGKIYQIFAQCNIIKIQRLYLTQTFINCVPFNFQQNQHNKRQKQIISYLFVWYNTTLTIQRQKQIRQSLNLTQSLQNTKQKDNFNTLFIDFIKKTIQNQFEYQFNKQSVNSVCNLFCYLIYVIDLKSNNKQNIMDIIKMLLNLNQSCQKQYREFLVKNIIRVICVYSKDLLRDNQFLKEVLQEKIMKSIFQYKDQIKYLNINNMLSENFYEKLVNLIKSQELFMDVDTNNNNKNTNNSNNKTNNTNINNVEFVFDTLLIHNKQILQNNVQTNWQWIAYLNYSGKKIYGKQWNTPEKQLKFIKQNKMASYNIQFDDDITKIQQLCGFKK